MGKVEKAEMETPQTETTTYESPLLTSLSKGDAEIRHTRAARAVSGIQRQLTTKWNQVMSEFRQLELRYETALDLSPKTTVDLGIEVGDVNRLVSELFSVAEAKHNLYNFKLVPLHEVMKQCFTPQEMETLYALPTV